MPQERLATATVAVALVPSYILVCSRSTAVESDFVGACARVRNRNARPFFGVVVAVVDGFVVPPTE